MTVLPSGVSPFRRFATGNETSSSTACAAFAGSRAPSYNAGKRIFWNGAMVAKILTFALFVTRAEITR